VASAQHSFSQWHMQAVEIQRLHWARSQCPRISVAAAAKNETTNRNI